MTIMTEEDWLRLLLHRAQLKAYRQAHDGHLPRINAEFEWFIANTPPAQVDALAAQRDHEFYSGVLSELKNNLSKGITP